MPSFSFHARYGLVTYAQCGDLDPFEVSNHFTTLGAECIIGREAHADGGTHLHVFFDFGQKRRIRRMDVFDVQGRHPNIEASRGTPAKGYDYAIKEGDVVAGGLERPSGMDDKDESTSDHHKWRQIVDAPTREEFFDLLGDLAPKNMVLSWTQVRAFANDRYETKEPDYIGPDITWSDDATEELFRWSRGNLQGHHLSGKLASLRTPLARGPPLREGY